MKIKKSLLNELLFNFKKIIIKKNNNKNQLKIYSAFYIY